MNDFKPTAKKGFSYYIEDEILLEYSHWSPEKKLGWLYIGNLFRNALPGHIKKIQDRFREGRI